MPISIFYPFFTLPLFLSSFSILQNTIFSLSSALDVIQSDFLCFHTDTILTTLANDKYISKNLPLLCLHHLQRAILIISIIMAKHLIQALMHAALISRRILPNAVIALISPHKSLFWISSSLSESLNDNSPHQLCSLASCPKYF